MKLIRHIIEPRKLYLVWQAPEGKERLRRVVGQLFRENTQVLFQYLLHTPDFEAAKKNGFEGYVAFKTNDRVYSSGVLEVFMRRLPPRSRTDFGDYLRRLGLPPDAELSDFALLGYSEAKLPGDGFSIINSFEDCPDPCEFLTEIAGFRYYSGMTPDFLAKAVGMSVSFKPVDDNPYDEHAVQIYGGDTMVGYVNRIQAKSFRRWLVSNKIEATIERINEKKERPQVNVFVSVNGSSEA